MIRTKTEFIEYLKTIGVMEPLQERIRSIYEFFKETCPEDIIDIFVDEFITNEGERRYTDVHFLSENFKMLAANFINIDDFKCTPLRQARGIRVQKLDYDFKKASDRSRMHVMVQYYDPGMTEFKASRENCDYLKGIIQKHYFPRLMPMSSSISLQKKLM